MLQSIETARTAGLNCGLVTDAGHTQVDPGTNTVGWIGPAVDSEIDKITGGYKLL